MRLMTIFQLAVLTGSELDALAARAQKDADNTRLPASDREAAARTRLNIRRVKPPKP